MSDNVLISIYNSDGTPKADASPSLITVRDITGTELSHPTIHNIGHGDYTFELSGDAGYIVSTGALPEYFGAGIGNGVWFALFDSSGAPKSDAVPAVTTLDWDGNTLNSFNATNIGSGLYWFNSPTAVFKVVTGCFPPYIDGDIYTSVTPAPLPPVVSNSPTTVNSPVRDIWCDFTTGKFYMNKGDLVLTQGKPAILQAIDIAVNTFLGTYWLDSRVGVDYWGKILVKNPNSALINQSLRKVILGVLGVVSVQNISITVSQKRVATIKYNITTDVGRLSGTVTGGI